MKIAFPEELTIILRIENNILLGSLPLPFYSYRIDEYYACCTTKRLCPNDIDGLEFLRFYLLKIGVFGVAYRNALFIEG